MTCCGCGSGYVHANVLAGVGNRLGTGGLRLLSSLLSNFALELKVFPFPGTSADGQSALPVLNVLPQILRRCTGGLIGGRVMTQHSASVLPKEASQFDGTDKFCQIYSTYPIQIQRAVYVLLCRLLPATIPFLVGQSEETEVKNVIRERPYR